ncbi:homing endonuclease associated repeat-containing protein [Intestinimonas butyriciproducens]|uniref:homing endonuclease associated repeat-containing protein n=1 Tax=Intestinimonas butyriciproducens TaxID=1297617 RepID=UPI003AF0B84F
MKQKKRGRFPGDIWFQRNVENLMRKTLREQQAQGKMRGTTVEDLRGTAWYKEEFQKHAKLFREIQKTQAEERAAHARSASLKEQAETAAMTERDKLWAAEHEGDSDEELLAYLRRCAAELGHTPMRRREVVGSTYISERFGNWAVALTMAGLRLPKKKQPKNTAINAYLKRRQNAESET